MLHLPTLIAFDSLASLTSMMKGEIFVIASHPIMRNALVDRLRLAHNTKVIYGPDIEAIGSPVDGAKAALLWVQPVEPDFFLVTPILKDTGPDQVFVLQASWLACILLPEWRRSPGAAPNNRRRALQTMLEEHGFSLEREIAIGNIKSVAWGVFSRWMLLLKRPDLADHCNARMRRELFPATSHPWPAYLSLILASRAGN